MDKNGKKAVTQWPERDGARKSIVRQANRVQLSTNTNLVEIELDARYVHSATQLNDWFTYVLHI